MKVRIVILEAAILNFIILKQCHRDVHIVFHKILE
jgi:hypothetical protein